MGLKRISRENMCTKLEKILSFAQSCKYVFVYRGEWWKKSGSDHHLRHGDWQLVLDLSLLLSTVSADLVDDIYCSYTILYYKTCHFTRLFMYVCVKGANH